jgi:hypothetical protein
MLMKVEEKQIEPRHLKRCQDKAARIEEVRKYLLTHPGAMAKDISKEFGYSYWSATLYLKSLRREWR